MAAQRPVDPRFDPRFQRGYDHSAAPVVTPPAPAPIADRAPEPAPREPIGVPRVAPDAVAAREERPADEADELEAAPRRNPFRFVLLLVSLALIALSVAIMWWIATHPGEFLWGSAVEPATGWMLQQLTIVVPPAALIAGLVGVGAWLGLGALESLHRATDAHPEPADDDD